MHHRLAGQRVVVGPDKNLSWKIALVAREEKSATGRSVLAVLVVYDKKVEEAACWPTVVQWLSAKSEQAPTAEQLWLRHLLVYDNSPGEIERPDAVTSLDVTYIHNPGNGGTSAAYESAADMGRTLGCDWLLLLDQDTSLPRTFLQMADHALATNEKIRPAAMVPTVRHKGQLISPAILTRAGSIKPVTDVEHAGKQEIITAIASGAIIRTEIVCKITPFPKDLWLDYVDHWMFLGLNRMGGSVAIFDADLVHDLSIKTPEKLSRARLKSILDGERLLISQLGVPAKLVYPVRLLKRSLMYLPRKPSLTLYIGRWVVGQLSFK